MVRVGDAGNGVVSLGIVGCMRLCNGDRQWVTVVVIVVVGLRESGTVWVVETGKGSKLDEVVIGMGIVKW